MYNAVVITQLSYGLETLQLTESLINRLNSFHVTGLKHLLDVDHPFYSRVSDPEVVEKANIIANSGRNLDLTWEQFR